MKRRPEYLLYATLLDAYQGYIGSDVTYNEYWGFSENPPFSEDEFHEKQRKSLIDRINRVPIKWEDSEKADRGTAFNEIVDCIILNCKSEKMNITSDKNIGIIAADYNSRVFNFPISLCREFAEYYRGSMPQVHTEGILPTAHGDVLLYGYIDELLPSSAHDIKTTGKYFAGKFKNHWQHIVYPYCLCANGNSIYDFEYNIAVINEMKAGIRYETFTEYYNYVPEIDIPRLKNHVEGLIKFIENHRDSITDRKIFNQHGVE
ncbi:MAG: HNH endonuclease [Prevotellaceae bacterium]|jgi:hypothetical protein|nr:HNH endonuclease [Prevotellaceae bacterium]